MREPLHLPPDATVREAAVLMRAERITSVLVVGRGALFGIVTDRDLRLRVIVADQPRVDVGAVGARRHLEGIEHHRALATAHQPEPRPGGRRRAAEHERQARIPASRHVEKVQDLGGVGHAGQVRGHRLRDALAGGRRDEHRCRDQSGQEDARPGRAMRR